MRVIDLFCGAGGFSTGFLQAGHSVIYGIDNDPRVEQTYRKNHPDTKFILADIQKLKSADFTAVDIVIGSPPCPDFSIANNKRDIEKGMELVNVFYEWVEAIHPKWWIMENVPPIEPYLDQRFPMKKVLDAVDYGVAQFRKRCFAGVYKIPAPTHKKKATATLDGGILQRWRTVKDVIGDLIELPPKLILTDQRGNIENCKANSPVYDATHRPSRTLTNVPQRQILHYLPNYEKNTQILSQSELNPKMLKKHPPMKLNAPSRSIISNFKRGGVYGLVELPEGWQDGDEVKEKKYMDIHKPLSLNQPSRTVTGRQGRNIKQAELRIEAVLENHCCFDNVADTKFEQANREVDVDEPCKTITAHTRSEKKIKTAKIVYRRLSVRECARLQSFSDEFVFYGSTTAQYIMVGNAVPPKMSFALGKILH